MIIISIIVITNNTDDGRYWAAVGEEVGERAAVGEEVGEGVGRSWPGGQAVWASGRVGQAVWASGRDGLWSPWRADGHVGTKVQ